MKKLLIALILMTSAAAYAQPVISAATNPIFKKNLIIMDSLTVGDLANDPSMDRIVVWDSLTNKFDYRQITSLPTGNADTANFAADLYGLDSIEVLFGSATGNVEQDNDFYFKPYLNRLYVPKLNINSVAIDNSQGRILVVDSVNGDVEYRNVSTITSATDLSFTGSSSPVTLNSSTGTDVTITAGGINTLSATSGNITITATEVDGSTTNELQTIANTSDATSHTVTLSNSGGSVKLVEGTNITLTTTGTSADGVVTIASPDYSSTFLKLDQTTPQTVSNGAPNFSGGLGVGVSSPTAKLGVQSTTEQMRLRYDASNYTSFTVNSAGGIKFNPSGNTTTAFNFTKADGTTSILNIDATNSYVGITNSTPAAKLHLAATGLGTTQSTAAGVLLENTTAAANGSQQISPALTFRGYGWKTTATAASQQVDWQIDVLPVQGTTAPSSTLRFLSSINGGAFTNRFDITSAGAVTAYSTLLTGGLITSNGGFTTGGTTSLYNLTGTVTPTVVGTIDFQTLRNFAPTSGTATYIGINLLPTINQSGGANGVTRSIYNGPTLTAAADYYFIESTAGKVKLTGTTQTGSMAETFLNLTNTWNTSGDPVTIGVNITNTASGTGARLMDLKVGGVSKYSINVNGKQTFEYTYTAGGTTGAQTIDKVSGSVNFAAGATSLVVTNARVTTNSIVFCQVMTNDATMFSVQAVPASGSFTIYPNAAPTSECRVGFFVIN